RYYEIIDAGDVSRIEEVLAQDFVSHSPPFPGLPETLEGVRPGWAISRAAFASYRHVIEDQFSDGDRVVTRVTATGVHTGDYRGIKGDGREVSIEGIAIHRIADGKIIEHWGRTDLASLLGQMT